MYIREEVFTREQKSVPIKHHTDTDDARAYHWVLYAPRSETAPGDRGSRPVGTLRLVPFPQAYPHPAAGAIYEAPTEDMPADEASVTFTQPTPAYFVDKASSLHDGIEPYIMLGRLCVLQEFRGKRYADILIQTALGWAQAHPEMVGKSGNGVPEWKGLVGIHAQINAKKIWERNGFVLDEEIGSCRSAGIEHVSMFMRLKI